MPVLCAATRKNRPHRFHYQVEPKGGMSVNEQSKEKHSSPAGQTTTTSSSGNIPRSKSFTGVLGHKRSVSTASADGVSSPESEVGVRTTWGPTLGQSFHSSSPRISLRNLRIGGTSKVQKRNNPRTARSTVMFEKIAKGLRECLAVTNDDVLSLRKSGERLSTHAQQQLKAAERYIKRLEYQLSKLEELQEQYLVQQKLREGMKTMAHAYVSSSGRERETALNSVKMSYREATEMMCAIEVQLEQMMGTLHFQMKGIQGFARLCSGDVFEITIKHSSQKWKSRGRVLKTGLQTWDSPHATFNALLGEVLYIKAVEIKGLGKTVLLGNKFCETRELFCAHPQIMTINLNPSGSLKLNVVITWNPLDGSIDDMMRSQMTQQPPSANSTQRSNRAAPVPSRVGSLLGPADKPVSLKKFLFGRDKCIGQDSLSKRMSVSLTSVPDCNKCHENNHSEDRAGDHVQLYQQNCLDLEGVSHLKHSGSAECCSSDDMGGDRECAMDGISVLEAVHNVSTCLEDIQGQYPELHSLELQISELEKMLGKRSRRGSHSSDVSTSIESVLECFDFLNTETDDEDMDWIQDQFPLTDKEIMMEPGLTAKTSDSGIGSMTHHIDAERAVDGGSSSPSGKGSSLQVIGETQIDLALVIHLSYCQHLVESLGSFGPLKCKEIYALEKLRKQIPVLESLIGLMNLPKEDRKEIAAVDELKDNSQLQQVWSDCSEYRQQLCVPANYMLPRLQEVCRKQLANHGTNTVTSVCMLLISRIVDMPRFDSEALVTVYQVSGYFQGGGDAHLGFDRHVEELAEEVQQTEILQSHDIPAILNTVQEMFGTIPPPNCLRTMSQLLMVPHHTIQHSVKSYLADVGDNSELRKKVLTIYIEALESDSSLVRQGSCLALMCLKASECIDQLAYLYQTDECTNVRTTAKEALLSFGDDGRRAYEQCQLSSLGFHGLGVK